MTEERRAELQNWLNILRRLAHTIDTPSLTEEAVAHGMTELLEAALGETEGKLAPVPIELLEPESREPEPSEPRRRRGR